MIRTIFVQVRITPTRYKKILSVTGIGVRDGGAGGAIAPPFFGQFEISFGHFARKAPKFAQIQ